MEKLNQLENELKKLRDELDKHDNNPQKSLDLRKKIVILTKKLEQEKGNRIVSPEQGEELFKKMKQDIALESSVKYRDFFN